MRKKVGVGLILFCVTTKKLLVVKELQDKPAIFKKAGMLSFPLETVEEGESHENTLVRLMREELGRVLDGRYKFFEKKFNLVPNADTYAAFLTCVEERIISPQDDDVAYHGWMKPEELLALPKHKRRVEVKEILQMFIKDFLPTLEH